MLTVEQLQKAFTDTNTEEPLSEGWSGLMRFAREVERMTIVEAGSVAFSHRKMAPDTEWLQGFNTAARRIATEIGELAK